MLGHALDANQGEVPIVQPDSMDPVGAETESLKDSLEPLLKRPSSLDDEESEKVQETAGPSSSQLYYPSCSYVYGPRPCHDVACAMIFVILVLASISIGIFSFVNHNSEYGLTDSALYNSSSGQCYFSYGYAKYEDFKHENSLERIMRIGKNLKGHRCLDLLKQGIIQMSSEERQVKSISGDIIVLVLVWTLAVTFVLTIPLICGLLWLLKAFAKQLVYACLPVFSLIFIFLNIFWFMACMDTFECQEAFPLAGRIALFLFVFVLCGIYAWIIYYKWYCVELTIKIMQTAAAALLRNWRLLLVLPSLTIALLIFVIPFILFLIYALMNGKIVAKSATYCEGDAATDCCKWRMDMWVPAYYALTIFTLLWSALVMAEAQVYTISGTIAQWYFTEATGSLVVGRIRFSLQNAFGPSFGTCCFSALIVSFVRIIGAAVDISQRTQNQRGCSFVIGCCCLKFILFAIEFLNKFTINFAAITGESYCVSARMSYGILKRNLLSPIFVDAISTHLLAGIVFALSTVYAVMLYAILRTATHLDGAVYYITVLVWIVLFILLFLFSRVLDKVIDTIYICYAIDKESGAVSKPEVHDVYLLLPVSHNQPPTLAIHQP